MPAERLEPRAFPDVVKTDEDRDRFTRLYDDLVRVVGLDPADALLHAATQFQLGFDVRTPFEKRKRRKRVYAPGAREIGAVPVDEPERPPSLEPPG